MPQGIERTDLLESLQLPCEFDIWDSVHVRVNHGPHMPMKTSPSPSLGSQTTARKPPTGGGSLGWKHAGERRPWQRLGPPFFGDWEGDLAVLELGSLTLPYEDESGVDARDLSEYCRYVVWRGW
jgi:hypothetical protein